MLYRLYVTSCVLYVFIKTDMENIILDIFLNLSKALWELAWTQSFWLYIYTYADDTNMLIAVGL